MKISELILMLQQIPNQDAPIKVSLQNRQDEIVELQIGGLLMPGDGFKDWSVFGISPDIFITRKVFHRLPSWPIMKPFIEDLITRNIRDEDREVWDVEALAERIMFVNAVR